MKIGILGAGVAGLSAAYFLRESGHDLSIHEASSVAGGLARSFRWHGFDCDLAPHRFYTDDRWVLAEISRLVPLRQVARRSRIYVDGCWLREPLSAAELVLKLPRRRAWKLLSSYLRRPRTTDDSFASLARGRFGDGLYELFFKPYSEKLFGIPADQIAASWGRRKLRIGRPFFQWRRESRLHFRQFYYPARGGYGAICGALYKAVEPVVQFQSRLTAICPRNDGSLRCTFREQSEDVTREFDMVISSLPVTYLASLMGVTPSLRFRPLRLLYLLINRPRIGPDQWFYLADRSRIINRVAEFKNFAESGAPNQHTVLCCEITEQESFSLTRVIDDLRQPCGIRESEILDTKIIDIATAYPIYDRSYEEQSDRLHRFFLQYPRIVHIGRAAQFAHQDIDEIFLRARNVVTATLRRQPASGHDDSQAGDGLQEQSSN